ncbi:hypothetical protein L3V77_07335 [Vibrio sp. DW001]|uniref:hypothetical protein n=1 Tax=Vibrio sp. DW001 TaxID=2912315 RepID=UPI0023AED8A4|nr:hypothetical protein [Vibrio sp. DW001]WED28034.1 hypothetical protein L3V77_07335 [Vibrio sp. DW001]
MKTSQLVQFLSTLPKGQDPDVVTGEEWLPESLIDASFDGDLVNLRFDNAPEEDAGDLEGRGFVEHEIVMLKDQIVKLMFDQTIDQKAKAELFLSLFILSHEKSSTEVIEILEDPLAWMSTTE